MNNVPNEGKVDFSKPILWIVIPCYNEKDVLPITAPMFLEQIQTMISKEKISANSRILFVNDGSKDGTASICREHDFRFLDLPINLGLAGAFQAGLKYADKHGYDCAIQFDADGQHRPVRCSHGRRFGRQRHRDRFALRGCSQAQEHAHVRQQPYRGDD